MAESVSRGSLVVAALLSVGVHVGTGVVASRYADGWSVRAHGAADEGVAPETLLTLASPMLQTPRPVRDAEESASRKPPDPIPPEPVEIPPPEPPREQAVMAGIDGSTTETLTWKGVTEAEATPHAAPKFDLDQAGFTRAEVGAGETGEVTPPVPPEASPSESSTTVAVESNPSMERPAQDTVAEEPLDAGAESVEAIEAREASPDMPETAAFGVVLPPPVAAQEAREGVEAGRPVTAPTPSDTPPAAAMAPTAVEPPASPGVAGLAPGVIADDESAPRSAVETMAVRLGRPVARPGLQIQTSYARFSVSAMVLNKPRSPLVRITFGRSGKVLRASFVGGQTTGSADVDKPLLDSLYRWSARGKDLLTIPADDPDAGVTLTFRIVL